MLVVRYFSVLLFDYVHACGLSCTRSGTLSVLTHLSIPQAEQVV